MIRRLFERSEGQALVEYALIFGLVAVVAAAGVNMVAPKLEAVFRDLAGRL